MGKPKSNTLEFVAKASKIHNNKYDYSKVEYVTQHIPVIVSCPIHGEFLHTPKKHLKYGCNKCAQEIRIAPLRVSQDYVLEKAVEIHGDKYDYSKVKFVRSHDKVEIICSKHGSFWQSMHEHVDAEHGCPQCGRGRTIEKAIAPRRILKDDFINESIALHGDLYDYSDIKYISYTEKIEIICKQHGKFLQSPLNHLNGTGCKQCKSNNASQAQRHDTKVFIDNATKIHNDTYDYSKVDYIKSDVHVIIICKIHGEFLQMPSSHLSGRGCLDCSGSKKSNTEDFIQKATLVHGNKYSYSKVKYVSARTRVQIECKKHGLFSQIPNNHLNGSGCNYCCESISRGETEWLDSLNISKENRYVALKLPNKARCYYADGFDPVTNTVYEFNGDFWHGNPEKYPSNEINPRTKTTFGELYQRTLLKESQLKAAGYNVASIWESDYEKQNLQ